MLFPGINDTRGKHKGSSAPGAGRGVRWSLVVLQSEKLLCTFCHFKGVRLWLMPSKRRRVRAEENACLECSQGVTYCTCIM